MTRGKYPSALTRARADNAPRARGLLRRGFKATTVFLLAYHVSCSILHFEHTVQDVRLILDSCEKVFAAIAAGVRAAVPQGGNHGSPRRQVPGVHPIPPRPRAGGQTLPAMRTP